MSDSELAPLIGRVAEALERLAPAGTEDAALDSAEGFVWHADGASLEAVPRINRLELSLLKGIDRVRDILLDNTRRFARGLPANNALLWGARGHGQELSHQGGARRGGGGRGGRGGRAQADRDSPRGDRFPAHPARAPARLRQAMPALLRRSLVRFGGHDPTSPSRRRWRAESAAGRTTSCSTPPPTAAI